jgi:hypothetical protein
MPTAQQVIDIAKTQVGYREGFSGGHWNNIEKYAAQVPGLEWANGYAWCDVFVAWCFHQAGLADFPVSASCAVSVAGWKSRKRWSTTPTLGAQVLYGPGGGEHTGIVVGITATTITTVEGNTNTNGSPEGDGVYQKAHNRADSYIYGYGAPAYGTHSGSPGGIASGTVHIPSAPSFPTNSPTPAPLTQEDDMTVRFTNRGSVYAANIGTGAFWTPTSEEDDQLRSLPGVTDEGTKGDFNDRQVDLIRTMCAKVAKSIKAV